MIAEKQNEHSTVLIASQSVSPIEKRKLHSKHFVLHRNVSQATKNEDYRP